MLQQLLHSEAIIWSDLQHPTDERFGALAYQWIDEISF